MPGDAPAAGEPSRLRLAVVQTAPEGGLFQYAAQLADGLAERGHDVDLLTARENELEGRGLSAARMRDVLTPPVPGRSEAPEGWRRTVRRGRIAGRLVRGTARILWELRRGGYDGAILTDDPDIPPTAAAALLLAGLPGGPPLAAICHEPRPRSRWAGDELYTRSPALYALLRRYYARLGLVLLHGERSRAEFLATWPPVPTEVIPHGDERLAGGDPQPLGDEERILFFGDWRRAKGLPELMAAFALLEPARPAARLTIAGTPSPDGDPASVRAWAAQRPERVEVIDRYLALDEVPGLFARARLVATPYVAGSQSGVVHLAMTAGRAVVASDVGELPQAVQDGVTGRIVPAGDVPALASALEEVLADRDLAARLGEAGRRRAADEFGWDRIAELVELAVRRDLLRV